MQYLNNRKPIKQAYRITPRIRWIVKEPQELVWTQYANNDDVTSSFYQYTQRHFYADVPIVWIDDVSTKKFELDETYGGVPVRTYKLIADWEVTVEPVISSPAVPYYDLTFVFNQVYAPTDDGYGNKPWLQHEYSAVRHKCNESVIPGGTVGGYTAIMRVTAASQTLKYVGHMHTSLWSPQLLASGEELNGTYDSIRLYMSINISGSQDVYWGTMSSRLFKLGITEQLNVRS